MIIFQIKKIYFKENNIFFNDIFNIFLIKTLFFFIFLLKKLYILIYKFLCIEKFNFNFLFK
jgi:hypothetical protein